MLLVPQSTERSWPEHFGTQLSRFGLPGIMLMKKNRCFDTSSGREYRRDRRVAGFGVLHCKQFGNSFKSRDSNDKCYKDEGTQAVSHKALCPKKSACPLHAQPESTVRFLNPVLLHPQQSQRS